MPLSVLMGRLLRLGRVRIPAVEVLLRVECPRVRVKSSAEWQRMVYAWLAYAMFFTTVSAQDFSHGFLNENYTMR